MYSSKEAARLEVVAKKLLQNEIDHVQIMLEICFESRTTMTY